KEVEQISESITAQRTGRFPRDTWDFLGFRAVQRLLTINPPTVRWLMKNCHVTKKFVKTGRDRRRKWKEVPTYSEDDLREYLRSRRLPFDGIYGDGRINLARAAMVYGHTHGEIGQWIARGWLSSEKQQPPPMKSRGVPEHTVYPRDLVDLVSQL